MRASAPIGRALCSFLQSTSSTEVESYRCVIQLANCATMQCADLWCGGKLLILYVNLPSILYSDYMLYSDHCMIGFLRLWAIIGLLAHGGTHKGVSSRGINPCAKVNIYI